MPSHNSFFITHNSTYACLQSSSKWHFYIKYKSNSTILSWNKNQGAYTELSFESTSSNLKIPDFNQYTVEIYSEEKIIVPFAIFGSAP